MRSTWTTTFSSLLVVKKPSEEEEAAATPPQMFDSNVELGRCFLSFNLHVVKTISGALRCLHVPHECLPCQSWMSVVFLTQVVVEPFHVGGGSLPLWTKP